MIHATAEVSIAQAIGKPARIKNRKTAISIIRDPLMAQAGFFIRSRLLDWIPAYAGITAQREDAAMTVLRCKRPGKFGLWI